MLDFKHSFKCATIPGRLASHAILVYFLVLVRCAHRSTGIWYRVYGISYKYWCPIIGKIIPYTVYLMPYTQYSLKKLNNRFPDFLIAVNVFVPQATCDDELNLRKIHFFNADRIF